ncbi:alpha/beta fold hydrolase [Noviherbaspirillum sedimenti]|uniref:Alpha/beta fold hydrolase n=1 Tax=Noviherbaspirillum sedimenti TaxID=2320865 RepID=A0A3A3G2X2_9BURK|nr:alpha/beta hydrolase [Noviherbaspirillum sedimenti]RJG02838.1 alpha/beta fold hydrolase [Noviherbaspirillum sedimenti]
MARIAVNGIDIEYEVHGDGSALLFIHGLGSCKEDWEAQIAPFAQRHKVISFDLRGHGQSDKPAGPYSIAQFAADTAGLLRGLGIDAAHVVGISLGGAVAFQLALDQPALVKTLTIVNSGPDATVRTLKEKFAVWMRNYIVRRKGMARLAGLIGPHLFPKPENRAERERFIERTSRNDPQVYLHAFGALIGWSVAERIGAIACPLLAIAADRDYTPLAMKKAYVAKIAGARLEVITDARHALPMEKPAQFNAVLGRFLGAGA